MSENTGIVNTNVVDKNSEGTASRQRMSDDSKLVNSVNSFINSVSNFDSGKSIALRAKLSRGAGKVFPDPLEAAQSVIESLDDSNKCLIDNERALNALYIVETLYAFHQQGIKSSVNIDQEYYSIGSAIRELALNEDGKEDEKLKKRAIGYLNPLFTARTLPRLAYVLRQTISILKGNNKNCKINYPKLAEDIYWWQIPKYRKHVSIEWAMDFYRDSHHHDADNQKEIGE